MSFGFSIGDIVVVASLANKVRKRFVDSPDQFSAISNEVKSLSNTLRDLEDVLPERSGTIQQKEDLQDNIKGCENVLHDLDKLLDKYSDLDAKGVGFKGKNRRLWKRLTFEPDDVKELRSRLTSNVGLLNAFTGSLSVVLHHATKLGVDRLTKHQDDQHLLAVSRWLSNSDFPAQHRDYLKDCQEGTGQWLLESQEFQTWLGGTEPTLFCPGFPGAGKTMLTSIVINHLQEHFESRRDIGIAYLFCNFRRQAEQTVEDLLASLLKQLIQGQKILPNEVSRLYEYHSDKGIRPSTDKLSKAIGAVAHDLSRTFIIIDALDECTDVKRTRSKLLDEIKSLQAYLNISLFASSRFIPEVEAAFSSTCFLEISASDHDVSKYIQAHMMELSATVVKNQALQSSIESKIIQAVDGMFLLARLHLDSLSDKTTPKAVRLALDRLPKGSDALDHAYKDALERIEGQKRGFKELAKAVLSWIVCAQRPLTILELRHALAVENGEPALDEENLPEADEMVSVCAGLVTVDQETNVIRLVHYTTQEYFERTLTSWAPHAQESIAETCLTYLSFEAFSIGYYQDSEEYEERCRLYILFDYAVRNWGFHSEKTSNDFIEQSVLPFLENEIGTLSLSQVSIPDYQNLDEETSKVTTSMHLAAFLGLEKTMMGLLKNKQCPDFKDCLERTPLQYAARNGQAGAVKLLIGRKDVNVNAVDRNLESPLFQAINKEEDTVLKLLLERSDVDINLKNINEVTPLIMAVSNNNRAAFKLLLERQDLQVNPCNYNGMTALMILSVHGDEAHARPLLERQDIQINYRDIMGSTALITASRIGHEAVVKLLLQRQETQVNIRDDTLSATALMYASQSGHEAMVKLLLQRHENQINLGNCQNTTALIWASKRGHVAVVKSLLERKDIQVNLIDDLGTTALIGASICGNEGVMKLLLERHDIQIDLKNDENKTALDYAVGRGYQNVASLLTEARERQLNPPT